MTHFKPVAFFLTVFLTPTLSFAQIITGEVIRILDGDTLVVLIDGKLPEKIRLTEIDAPERSQPYGNRSRQALADLCFRKKAILNIKKRDYYGRLLARVQCNNIDVNAEQIRTGMAWVYDRYHTTDNSLYKLQEEARKNKIGLWADPYAFPPWLYRKR
ncbi:putative endonuclease precursor [Legionella busanensis]|uniref:Putative endonuclease n=1 Tax=Legionella busanensis TaxID=190655 RepID=A0A378JI96_9GAMM|nr:thermonuclease family protein [Legionella busanensis]STX50398.1 putative endonuclease precursor [Legionella busanensis]